MSRARVVCLTVSTPASRRAPAAAKPEVNSATKLRTTTERLSTGMKEETTRCARASCMKANQPMVLARKTAT